MTTTTFIEYRELRLPRMAAGAALLPRRSPLRPPQMPPVPRFLAVAALGLVSLVILPLLVLLVLTSVTEAFKSRGSSHRLA